MEFALTLPLLALILVGTIDFGRVFYMAMAVTNAARAGAQYGAQSTIYSGDTTGMETAALNSATDDIGAVTASGSLTCACAPNSPTSPSYSLSSPSPNTCTGTCTSSHIVALVTVTVTRVFSTISWYPGIPHTLSISRAAQLRVQ